MAFLLPLMCSVAAFAARVELRVIKKKTDQTVYGLFHPGVVGWRATWGPNNFSNNERALTPADVSGFVRLPEPIAGMEPHETTLCATVAEIGGDVRILFPRRKSGLPYKGLDPADYTFLFAYKGTRDYEGADASYTCIKACFQHNATGNYTTLTAYNADIKPGVESLVDGWWASRTGLYGGAVFWNKLMDIVAATQ